MHSNDLVWSAKKPVIARQIIIQIEIKTQA